MENNNTDYNAKLQAILQSANPQTYKGTAPASQSSVSTGTVYIARQLLDNEIFWRIIGIYPTKAAAEAELKKQKNWDENESAPKIDKLHLIPYKTGTTDPVTINLIINAMKKMINSNSEDFSESGINEYIEC